MSLTDFVKHPAARAIYDQHVAVRSMRLPPREDIVPCSDIRLAGAMGTAFDYMARLRLHALSRQHQIVCVEGEWIAETALSVMRATPDLLSWIPRWSKLLEAARSLQNALIIGSMTDPARLAICSQYLGAADLLVRVGTFRPDFKHSDTITNELVKLDACLDYAPLLPLDGGLLCLNPGLPAGRQIGGADPDIIAGSTVIDIKTTIRPSADSTRLRQICAYAALCDVGGIRAAGGRMVALPPITHVGLSFSRQNLHVRYSLDELFAGRYDNYKRDLTELACCAMPS